MPKSRDNMKGWTVLYADVSWADYGGMWAKSAGNHVWFVLKFENMYEAAGERDCKVNGTDQYECQVLYLDLKDITAHIIGKAVEGYRDDKVCRIDSDGSWRFRTLRPHVDLNECDLVASLVSYGISAPLAYYTSDTAPWKCRNEARRAAEEFMKDEDELESALDRPVNQIGSSARDFGRGRLGAWDRRDAADDGVYLYDDTRTASGE